ncbi:MAG TPA: hypothetical protein VFO82_16280 [Steroidobacteraceae bacterium]|nr:hypothetical protein [Steroidobacteraceae bacterium]
MKHSVAAGLAALAAFNGTAALAQDAETDWSFEVAPFLLAAGMDGTAGVRGVEAEIDMDFDTILDNLDSAFMARFEARRGPWGVGLEGIYFRLKGEEVRSWSGPLGNTNTAALNWSTTEKVFQTTLYYELLRGETKLDALVGARYTELDSRLALTVDTGAPLLPDGARDVGRNEDWIDPVIGARVRAPISDNWYVLGYADIGGFGAGADLTYQLFASFGWQYARQWSLEMGYRYFYQDYRNADFKWDVTTSGPQLGLAFSW